MENSSLNEIINKNLCLIVIIIVIIVLIVYCLFSSFNQNNAPIIINRESFNETNNKKCKLYKLVFYYTDWCGYCQKFKPEWEKFVQHVSDENINNLVLEKIDCDKQKNQCKNITGFPTIILYDDKENEINMNSNPNYTRTKEGLINFVNDNMKY